MKIRIILLYIIILVTVLNAQDDGQAPSFISVPQIGNIKAGSPIQFEIVVTDVSPIESVRLYYKTADDKAFTSVEMEKDVNYTAEIPGFEVVEGPLEYYFWAKDTYNNQAFYPERGERNPLKISVGRFESQLDSDRFSLQMLYPEPDVQTEDEKPTFVFLVHDPDNLLNNKRLKVILNSEDISGRINRDGSILTYLPERQLSAGSQNLSIRLEEPDGQPLFIRNYPIQIGKSVPAGPVAEKPPWLDKLRVNANVGLDSDYDIFYGKDQPENRPMDVHKASARVRLRYGKVQLNTSALLNAYVLDENARELSERRQPLNRLRIDFRSPILDMTFGDASPDFTELTMKGTRVRGLSAWLKLGWWQTAYVHGTTRQLIDPIVTTHPDSVHWQMMRNLTGDTLYVNHDKGTPVREFRGLSTSMDFFNHVRMGVSTFKSYDDIASLNLDYKPLEDHYLFLANSVVGVNTELHFNHDRTVLSGEIAVSATNDLNAGDSLLINEGGLDSTTLNNINELLGYPLTDDIFLGSSQGMGLSIPFPNLDDLDPLSYLTDNVVKKGTYRVAFRTPLNLKVLQVDLNSEYFRVPANFVTIGNPSLQTDIQGLRSGARIRMLKNQLSFTTRYENTFDNVAGNTKTQTTNTESVVAGVGLNFYGLPMLNYSVRIMDRLGEPAEGHENPEELTLNNNQTITHTISPSYQFTAFQTQFNINGSYMLMDYQDANSTDDYNTNYLTQSLTTALTAGFEFPLSVTVGGGFSTTDPEDIRQASTRFIIHSSRIGYKWMENRLNTYIGYSMVDGFRDKNGYYDPGETFVDENNDGEYTDGEPFTDQVQLDNSKFTFKAGAGYKIMKNLTIDGNLDLIVVNDYIDPDKEYNEIRFRMKLKYWF
jgi:hypothetical protein